MKFILNWRRYVVNIMLFCIAVLALADGIRANFPDSRAYYSAASGHPYLMLRQYEDGMIQPDGWNYAKGEERLWWLYTLFHWNFARLLMFGVGVCIVLFIVKKLEETTQMAWVFVFMASWALQLILSGQNYDVAMLALALNPWTACLSCMVKPQGMIFVLAHWYLRMGKPRYKTFSWRAFFQMKTLPSWVIPLLGIICSSYVYFGLPKEVFDLMVKYRGVSYQSDTAYVLPLVILLWHKIPENIRKPTPIFAGIWGIFLFFKFWATPHFYDLMFTGINH